MLRLVLDSGVLSVTLWVAVLALAFALWSWLRGRRCETVLPHWIVATPVLLVLALGVLLGLALGLYKGYVIPRDLMQDIVSAQEFLAGRSLYPNDMNERMRAALEREPPHSLLAGSPELLQREADGREEMLHQHWVQAHPPLMTLAVVPFVATVGIGGTYAAMTMISLACLAVTLLLIRRGLDLTPGRRWLMFGVLVLLGWDNVIVVLRAGQPGLIVGMLLVGAWFLLRRGSVWQAGVCIGLAAGLKIFPALLLFYLLLRHRRAFVSAVLTLSTIVVFVGLVAGWDVYREHFETARGVMREYAAYPGNLSLLGLIARFAAPFAPLVAPLLFYAMGFVIVGALALFIRSNVRQFPANHQILDLEYALLMTVMVMLSPVAWDHYLSLLIFPLAVLGLQVLARHPSGPRAVAFFALLAVLAIPDTTYTQLALRLTGPMGSLLGRALILPLRTYALAALCYWLVRCVVRLRTEPAALRLPSLRIAQALPLLGLLAILAGVVAFQVYATQPSEPFFNNDETRHVMTGVFFRDLFVDTPSPVALRQYTVNYYLQYPALGLLIWPPFFYAVEGVTMLLFGTSFATARLLIAAFALLACVYLFRLARRTHGPRIALLGVALFAMSPLVFLYSHQVMLEIPTLALALVALFHVQRYLDEARRRDLALCCGATALTALTRFDGIFLLPLFVILIVGRRQWTVLRRPSVWLAAAAAVLVVLPWYLLSAHEIGSAHVKAMRDGTDPASTAFFAPENFSFYLAHVPSQVGWFVTLAAILGFGEALSRVQKPGSWPYLALAGATYLTFTPMAELETRHAIYWVPALAVFAADGVFLVARGLVRFRVPEMVSATILGVVLLVGTIQATLHVSATHVVGYESAARYVLEHSSERRVCLFDGFLNGDFIYQTRRNDPDRRLWILRGDKLLYGVLSEPHGGYEEWAETEAEVLAIIDNYDPEYLVIEQPQILFDLPAAALLRKTLADHPERFCREVVIPIESNNELFRNKELWVYRNSQRNNDPATRVEVRMLGLGGRALDTAAPR